jgi:hypothetical protein
VSTDSGAIQPKSILTFAILCSNIKKFLVGRNGTTLIGFYVSYWLHYQERRSTRRYMPLPAEQRAGDLDVYVEPDFFLDLTFL